MTFYSDTIVGVYKYRWIYFYMPVDPDFPKNYEVIGKHNLSDKEHFHYV